MVDCVGGRGESGDVAIVAVDLGCDTSGAGDVAIVAVDLGCDTSGAGDVAIVAVDPGCDTSVKTSGAGALISQQG